MLGYVHDSTTIWRFWDPHRRQVIQASNVTFLESVQLRLGASSKLNSSGGLGLDASAVGLGLGASSRLRLDASAVGLGRGASSELNSLSELNSSGELNSSSELNSSGGLGLDASAVGLELGAWSKLNSSVGLRLDSSVGELGLDPSAVGLGLCVSTGCLGNLEGNTGWYNLRKRPRAVAHQIRVEEEPMDSADPVSYWEAIAHPGIGQKWFNAVDDVKIFE